MHGATNEGTQTKLTITASTATQTAATALKKRRPCMSKGFWTTTPFQCPSKNTPAHIAFSQNPK